MKTLLLLGFVVLASAAKLPSSRSGYNYNAPLNQGSLLVSGSGVGDGRPGTISSGSQGDRPSAFGSGHTMSNGRPQASGVNAVQGTSGTQGVLQLNGGPVSGIGSRPTGVPGQNGGTSSSQGYSYRPSSGNSNKPSTGDAMPDRFSSFLQSNNGEFNQQGSNSVGRPIASVSLGANFGSASSGTLETSGSRVPGFGGNLGTSGSTGQASTLNFGSSGSRVPTSEGNFQASGSRGPTFTGDLETSGSGAPGFGGSIGTSGAGGSFGEFGNFEQDQMPLTEEEKLVILAGAIGGGDGIPGEDYPILSTIPDSGFMCEDQSVSGYYADTSDESRCQVFHICQIRESGLVQKDSFLCPNGTIFNQQYLVCDWWYNFDCSSAEEYYSVNQEVAEAGIRASATTNVDGNFGRPVEQSFAGETPSGQFIAGQVARGPQSGFPVQGNIQDTNTAQSQASQFQSGVIGSTSTRFGGSGNSNFQGQNTGVNQVTGQTSGTGSAAQGDFQNTNDQINVSTGSFVPVSVNGGPVGQGQDFSQLSGNNQQFGQASNRAPVAPPLRYTIPNNFHSSAESSRPDLDRLYGAPRF